MISSTAHHHRPALVACLATTLLLAISTGCRQPAEPMAASETAVKIDQAVDWSQAELIVVQDAGRYKTLDSFARECMAAMYGQDSLPGLTPVASLFEWLFNSDAYSDAPVIRIKDRGLRIHFSTHLPEKDRQRIVDTGYMTPNELDNPVVRRRIRELEPRFDMGRAIGRVRSAQTIAVLLPRLMTIVPQPGNDPKAPWHTVNEIEPNAALILPERRDLPPEEIRQRFGVPVPGITPEQAATILGPWQRLEEAWNAGDADTVQQTVNRLATALPALAPSGAYPDQSQRAAEATYYRWGKFTWGYALYFLATLFGVWALMTRWWTPWIITLLLLLVAIALHAFGVGLRWYILGRIPVANMFEAVTFSAWIGVVVALLLELIYRRRVFLLAASFTGFFALLLANQVLPGELTTMMGILDDINLRLHTTLIIAAYALIFVAAVIAAVYLIGYYFTMLRRAFTQMAGATTATATEIDPQAVYDIPERPLLAGAMPGDEVRHRDLPEWLHATDWCHLIVLNIMVVMLFLGGIVLGAVWADYSWGRPWGWDPKEVFALNTWLVYVILFHVRYVVKNKGLWTAWLSIVGCAMMAFNWWVVNFFIAGLHSYA